MSKRKRCCCNCRRCIRTWDDKGNCTTHCEIDGHYIGYVECFEDWCRRWAKDKWQEKGNTMSKYINLEDAIEAYNQAVTNLVESEMEEFDLGDFTECSFNTTQIKLIARMIADLSTIEVSEDCISREYLKSFEYINKGDFNSVETIREWIDNAPSVVPSRAEGEWINKQEKYQMAECSNCKKVTMHEMWGDKLVYYDYCPNCGAKMKG